MGRDQVTHTYVCRAMTPGLDPEGQQSSSFTGTQELLSIPPCDNTSWTYLRSGQLTTLPRCFTGNESKP